MHCLPAHRGEKSPPRSSTARSPWWQGRGENRLHAQKALMEYLGPRGIENPIQNQCDPALCAFARQHSTSEQEKA